MGHLRGGSGDGGEGMARDHAGRNANVENRRDGAMIFDIVAALFIFYVVLPLGLIVILFALQGLCKLGGTGK